MRRVTGNTAFGLHRRVLVNKGTLLISVTFNTGCVSACCQSRLLQFKTTMWVMTVGTLHRAFQHFMVERQVELVLDFGVTTQTELRFVHLQRANGRETGLLCVCVRYKDIRTGDVFSSLKRMRGVTIDTTNVITPVLAPTEVFVLFFSCVTGKTGF